MRIRKSRGRVSEDTMEYKAGSWVVGAYSSSILNGKHYIHVEQVNNYFASIPVEAETVGEYVELLDVFEGDVLQGDEDGTYWIGEVRYIPDRGIMAIREISPDTDDWYDLDDYHYDRVIGNIHDNPYVEYTCHNCGQPIEEDDEFCSLCRRRINWDAY